MPVITETVQQQIQDQLISSKVLTKAQLETYLAESKAQNVPLLTLLVDKKYVNPEQLTKATATVCNIPYVNLSTAQINQNVLGLLSKDIAERYMAVPLGEMHNRLAVAMLDGNNVQAVDFLSQKINRPLKVYMASEEGIRQVLSQYHTDLAGGVSAAVSIAESDKQEKTKVEGLTISQDSPISRALSTILEYAAKARASDVHIEPLENTLKIRCRIDGVLREVMKLPKSIEPALISRVKILSNLKIDEHRTPQDGQFAIHIDNRDIDLRIAISPVVWGEQVVIRLLDKSGASFDLEEMGYVGRTLRAVKSGIARPNGMILTSGPTGSGKSTSLYALVKAIFDNSINIVTLEDPVEYKIQGVNQIQVNPDVGLTFANGLRSILRQDPDVVMVGEIRDRETAELAVQASLTGHLVFSTLHTNSAAGVLPRLLDMGIEPFLIASTVNTIIGQRLVRRISEDNKRYQSNELETKSIQETVGSILPKTASDAAQVETDLGYKGLPLSTETSYTLTRGVDSPMTPGGFKGRLGLYEAMTVSESIQTLITRRATSSEIQRQAIAEGMITMRQDGYFKALQGRTTLDEVNRVASNMA